MPPASVAIMSLVSIREAPCDAADLVRAGLTCSAFGDAVVVVDSQGCICFASPQAERLLHLTQHDMLGMPIELAMPLIDAETRQALEHPVYRRLRGDEGSGFERPVRLRAGERELSLTTAPVVSTATDPNQPICGIIITIRTAERALLAHEQLQQIEEERQTDRMRVLAGGVAHDPNNLLTGIAGYIGSARLMGNNPEIVAECLSQIAAASRRATNLTQQLLTYAGRARVSLLPIDINPLVGGVAQQFADTTGSQIRIRAELGENLPQVAADSAQLQLALVNVLTNAHEAIGEQGGEIMISTSQRQIDVADLHTLMVGSDRSPGVYVAVCVSDSGSGMDRTTRSQM
ncbi:MAG TPA: PAS domain-containing protein, partial [Roseiflexaceae bacterium]|nr:PAS domain-containing protein [Roseiflexaceae bacterium]